MDEQIYNAITQFKWFPDIRTPPTTMCNPLVFYKTMGQWSIEQSNAIASKAAKKAEKDA